MVGPFTFDIPSDDDYGPWTIGDAAHNDVAQVYSNENATVNISRGVSIATARLFAAAPELVDALNEARDVFAEHYNDIDNHGGPNAAMQQWTAIGELLRKIGAP